MRSEKGDEGIYDLATEPPRPVKGIAQRKPAAPLQYRSAPGKRAPVDTDTIKNIRIPLWLLAGGIVVEVVAAFLRQRDAAGALIEVGCQLIVGTGLMLAGIFLAARLRGFELGAFWIAVFKLSAISIAPAAALDLASPLLQFIPFGALLGWAGSFVLYFALLGALFDLEESDTWYCVCVIFLVRLVIYFALLGMGWV